MVVASLAGGDGGGGLEWNTLLAPCNLPLLSASPRIDGFRVLIVGLPQGRD